MDLARKHGRIDALINNAGVAESAVLPLLRPDQIQRVLSINLEAAIMIAQAVSRIMLSQRSGRIINVSSIVGSRGFSGLSVYSATKAALDGLTRSMARELGPRGILVNSLAPGFIETDMSDEMPPAQRKQVIRRTPLGRLGNLADVTGVVRFLLSPASAYITGQVITVDGGSTC
jgi:3-oxoacyl-[acyl-carrier protein] reductase